VPHSLQSDAAEFRALAQRLKDAGERGLRRELTNAIRDAVKPLKGEILDPEHLKPYMPDNYVPALLRDLRVTTFSRAGLDAGVSIRAEARTPRGNYRQVVKLEEGSIRHPVFGNREVWRTQFRGMRPGFFSGPVREHGPRISDAIVAAGHDVAQKITKG
jgi:hypothetical protein